MLPAQGAWRQVGGVGVSRENGGMCYDTTRGELVRYNYALETWAHDGDRWERRPITGGPPPRPFTLMACDEARGKVVLASGGNLFDTWEWNGQAWTLRNSDVAIMSNRGGMGYDRVRQRVLLVTDTYRTFEWSGSSWQLRSTGSFPVESMTWHDTRNRLVGVSYFGISEYDGTQWQFIQGGSLPQSGEYQIAYDRRRQVLVVIRSRIPATQAYEWNGTQWTLVPTTLGPGLHYGARASYDPNRARVVFGGGQMNNDSPGAFWEWDGSAWTPLGGSPLAGAPVASTYDPVRNRVVLLGPVVVITPPLLPPKTYEWDGQHWATMRPLTTLPSTADMAIAFDGQRQRSTVIADSPGGLATFDWDGVNWTPRVTTNPPPSRTKFAIAYDGARQQFVMFGGYYNTDTWLLSGATWTQANPTNVPPARVDHTMAYDPIRQRVVMYSGTTIQTWEWDGTDWTRRFPARSPTGRSGQSMTWDPERQRVVLTGGCYYQLLTPIPLPADVWEWDGTTWSQRSTAGGVPTAYAALVHDGSGLLLHVGQRQPPGSQGLDLTSETLHLQVEPLAAVAPYGIGCATTVHELLIDAQFVPSLGNPGFALRLTNGDPQIPALLAYGTGAANVPLGGSCSQLVAPVVASEFRVTTVAGAARFAVPIPNDPGLVGVTLFAQGATLGANGPFAGLELSRGLRFDLGH